ncbi:MAG TPA: SCO family protein [Anaerolineales bacterium]|nr:SCO family protein [Anaerolineales bacterium]
MNRRFLLLALASAIMLGGGIVYELTKPPSFYGSVITPPASMPDFTLQSVNGPVKLSDFWGKYVLLYFGYTSCPDLCPTTLAKLQQVVTRQADWMPQVQVIFVSVDYLRDTPEKLNSYVRSFSDGFIGITGTKEQIDVVTREYGIYYKLNTSDPQTDFYSVDHSASVLVFNRQGEMVLTWPYGLDVYQMASDLQELLNR